MNSIPLDLFYDIFSRLPAKSVGRSRCVSVQWRSTLCSADFTEYFSTNTRSSLLFAMDSFYSNEFIFFSSPQIQSKSSSSAAAAYFKLHLELDFCGHASGLFLFRRRRHAMKDQRENAVHHVICYPCTGQHVFLPTLLETRSPREGFLCLHRSFLGFDPIDKVFKVFTPDNNTHLSSFAYIFTLGTGEKRWRKIHIPLAHSLAYKGICINGYLYYLAQEKYATTYLIVCFDVRSEKFKFIDRDERFVGSDTRLINYKGNLGVISRSQEEVRIGVLKERYQTCRSPRFWESLYGCRRLCGPCR